jgi:5-hydroxyisourate hydrolase-like protein (transthyretin family)
MVICHTFDPEDRGNLEGTVVRARGRYVSVGGRRSQLRLLFGLAGVCAALLLTFASTAGAAWLGGSLEPAWGPAGPRAAMHGSPAARVDIARRARAETHRGAIATVAATGTIEGTVTDAVSKAGISGIEVCAWPGEGAEEPPELPFPECVQSDAKGAYVISGVPAGEYIVEFSTPFNSTINYVSQFYAVAASFEEAEPVFVEAGAASTADAKMVHGGSVSGHVTSVDSATPLQGIEVCAWRLSPEAVGCAETDASGKYEVTGLAPGAHKVGFRSPPGSGLDWVAQFYNAQSSFEHAVEIDVTKEATTNEVNAAMERGGEIEGVVTLAANGQPAAEVLVCALESGESAVECALTDTNGRYTIAALAAGSYRVGFAGGPELEAEYYKEAFSFQAATVLPIGPGSVLTSIDAAMYPRALRPENTVFPTISGAIAVGSAVSCSAGGWSGTTPMTLAYQWLRDRAPIVGATTSTYTIQSADVGHVVACEVTASNRRGSSWARSAGYRVPAPIATETGQSTGPPAKGAVLPSVTVVPVALAAGRVKVSRHLASVRLLCKAGPCHGTLQLFATLRRSHRSGGHTVIRRVSVVLGSGSFSLGHHASATVTFHLTAAGRRLLAGAARHPRPEKLKLLLAGAATTVRAVTVY